MTWLDAIRLGRLSNLPTVWTNALAGVVLAGGGLADAPFATLIAALSLAYVGGMYLNDAFDADIDRRERPQRPIPSGRVGRQTVLALGFAMLAASLLLLTWMCIATPNTGPSPAVAGLGLAAAIVVYDWHHKGNPLSPVLMGLCRALVYLVAGLAAAAATLPYPVAVGAGLLWSYVIGLTYLAKQETLGRIANLWPLAFLAAPLLYGISLAVAEPLAWPFLLALAAIVGLSVGLAVRRHPGDIGRAIVLLIAGISLFDALMIAGAGSAGLAAIAVLGFPVTVALQRVVPGT